MKPMRTITLVLQIDSSAEFGAKEFGEALAEGIGEDLGIDCTCLFATG